MTIIDKAVIPIAGLGTRLQPMTLAIPKAMFPLVDPAGRCRPVIHWILSEVASAGVTQTVIVVSPGQEMVAEYVEAARRAENCDLPQRVEFVLQDQPKGFGAGVARAGPFVGDDPFVLMLGDYVFISPPGRSCVSQVVGDFNRLGAAAVVAVQAVGAEALVRCGVGRGEPVDDGLYRCVDFVEKPTVAQARDRLVTPGLPEGKYLAHAGVYALSAEIFDCLDEVSAEAADTSKEVELAAAQSKLLARRPDGYFLRLSPGDALDTGTPECYAEAFKAFRDRGA